MLKMFFGLIKDLFIGVDVENDFQSSDYHQALQAELNKIKSENSMIDYGSRF